MKMKLYCCVPNNHETCQFDKEYIFLYEDSNVERVIDIFAFNSILVFYKNKLEPILKA